MADLARIQFLRTTTAGKKPTTSQISVGELAINLTDKLLYTSDGTNIINLGFATGGDVTGNINQTGNFTTTGTVTAPKFVGALTGNATTATTLQTARTINGTSFNGSANITTANWGTTRTLMVGNSSKSVNGSANVGWTLAEIGAIAVGAGYTDSFAPAVTYLSSTNTTYADANDLPIGRYLIQKTNAMENKPSCGGDSYCYVEVKTNYTATAGKVQVAIGYSNGVMEIRSLGGNPSTTTWSVWKQVAFTSDDSTGNSATATKLATARTINGTSFNGTANITTTTWGTARNLTIGNTSKSVNGSANITWSLAEIGALPLTGGTVTGVTTFQSSLRPTQWIDFGHSATADANRGIVFYSTGTTQKGQIAVDTNSIMSFTKSSSYSFDGQLNLTANSSSWLNGLNGNTSAIKIPNATTSNFHSWIQQTGTGGTGYGIGILNDTFYISGITAENIANSKNTSTAIMSSDLSTINFRLPITSAGLITSTGGFSGDVTGNLTGNVTGTVSGNAGSATKLATARTLSWTGDVTGSTTFDGTANKATAMTLANSGATAGTYKSVTVNAKGLVTAGTAVTTGLVTSTSATGVTNVATTNTNTYLNITEQVGTATTTVGTSTQVTGAGTVTVTSDTNGKLTITGAQSITGNAATATTATTATKLTTARTINGTSFNGSANITTANWGTARTFTIGGVSKSVNGSANVTWTLPELGIDVFNIYAPIAFPYNVLPNGYLAMAGQAISQTTYPNLYSIYGGTLPDLRGVFIRGLDWGRGLDPNRTVVSYQEDAMQTIWGNLGSVRSDMGATSDGAFTTAVGSTVSGGSGNQRNGVTIGFNSSRVVRSADETRPKNVAFLYIVKAG